jgi:hypothetical protein
VTWLANGLDPDHAKLIREALIASAGGEDALARDGGWQHYRWTPTAAPLAGRVSVLPASDRVLDDLALGDIVAALGSPLADHLAADLDRAGNPTRRPATGR